MPRPMLLKHKIINSDLFADPERIRVVTVICCLILAFPSAQILGFSIIALGWENNCLERETFYLYERPSTLKFGDWKLYFFSWLD